MHHDQTGLYSTWNNRMPPGQLPDASMNERAQETMSPKGASNFQLAGSSHLQFLNDGVGQPRPGAIGETPNQGRAFSPIPHQHGMSGAQEREGALSPTSGSMIGNLMALQ